MKKGASNLTIQAEREVCDKAFWFEQIPCSDCGKYGIQEHTRLLLCHLLHVEKYHPKKSNQ
jgi:hypothetical protein